MNDVIKKCKTALQKHYKGRFKGLLLYGSKARDQAEISSDIDMLVLLTQAVISTDYREYPKETFWLSFNGETAS
ncbi:MAG: hypothetical protein GF421_10225 [Candidatus Aminicenantes bacterium]|nr:hypothetical protein [Candidatus Aminicenantes bacterium]